MALLRLARSDPARSTKLATEVRNRPPSPEAPSSVGSWDSRRRLALCAVCSALAKRVSTWMRTTAWERLLAWFSAVDAYDRCASACDKGRQ